LSPGKSQRYKKLEPRQEPQAKIASDAMAALASNETTAGD